MVSALPLWLRRLSLDRRANVAIMTAFCALPLIGMVGLSIDYALLVSNKVKLDAAADAAAVAAVTKAKTVLNGGGTLSAAIAAGHDQGVASFQANEGSIPFSTSGAPIEPNVNFCAVGQVVGPNCAPPTSGQTLNVNVSYALNSQSQFGRLFNVTTHTISGSSSSSTTVVPFYQFIFVVDISGSMAVGGTQTDINGMMNDSNINKCAFACHDPQNNRGPDFYSIAHNDGWTLKIDYVRSAIQTFITSLNSQKPSAGVFSVGIDTFATSFAVLQAPTTNLTGTGGAWSVASTITIEPMQQLVVSQGYTRTTTSLQAALATALPTIGTGDGSSSTNQATYFIFLSDGVEDIEGNMKYNRGTDVSYTSACAAMKTANAKVISIQANYPVISNDTEQYPFLVAPLAPPAQQNYTTSMQNCASMPISTWYALATDGAGINAAVQNALKNILQGLTRLTN